MGHGIFFLVMLLTVFEAGEGRHIVQEQVKRSPTRSRLVVVRGTGSERKLVLLNDPGVQPLDSRRDLDVNITRINNDISRSTIEKSETSSMIDSSIGNNQLLSSNMDLSKTRRLRIGTSLPDQHLSSHRSSSLSNRPLPVKISGNAVDGVDINVQRSFGDINIPKGIEAALKRLRGENWPLYREMNEHSNHVHVNNVRSFKGHNHTQDSIDVTAVKSPSSRNTVGVSATMLQAIPASRPQDVQRTHETSVHSRQDQRSVGTDGVIDSLYEPQLSNTLRKQSPLDEKLNLTDAVPLSMLGISSSKDLHLSSSSSSVSASHWNAANNSEGQLTIATTSTALNASDWEGLKSSTAEAEQSAPVNEVLKAGPYPSQTNNNGELPNTAIRSSPEASAVRVSSSSSSMRSTKVIKKAVQKMTFSKTRVISAKTNTGIGSKFALGSDPNVSFNSSAVVSSKQPHLEGSIEVQKDLNGKTKIILKDANNNPIVLQASGPVEIQRIVFPNGRIKFIVNPIRETTTIRQTTLKQRAAEETELEAEEISATTTAPAEETEVPSVEPLPQSTSVPTTQSFISSTEIISMTTLAKKVISTGSKHSAHASSANAPKMKREPN